MIRVQIDDRLRVRKLELPLGHEEQIKARLTVANGEKAAALKRRDWGADDLPDAFALYEDIGPWLVMPRGYAAELRAGLTLAGQGVAWEDKTSATSLRLTDLVHQGPTLRPEQERACAALLTHRQGVLQAPTAAGKTVIVLEAWRRTGLRGLILVEKAGLARQWRERAAEHLGLSTDPDDPNHVGIIGEGEWDEQPLTVAMMQTLRRRELSPFWWRRWGFTCADEAHHLQAVTYQDLVKRVCSRYLIGTTATPLENDWCQPLLTHVIGPVFHITSEDELRRAGLRVSPMIKRVRTGWRWQPTEAEKKLVDTKAIYRHVIAQLEGDADRVKRIAHVISSQPPTSAQLVVSKRLGYLGAIRAMLERLGYEGEIMMMRGEEHGVRRMEIAARADAGGCVILSTVADEGTDIPRLDRLHLVWPARKELTIIQQVGRVLRTHPDKRGVVVFDYVDEEGMLASQALARLRVYRRAGYAIEEERAMQPSFTGRQ